MENKTVNDSVLNEVAKGQVANTANNCQDEQLIEKAKQAMEFKKKHPGAIMGVFMSPSIVQQ